MKKLFTLIALLATVVSGAWATEEYNAPLKMTYVSGTDANVTTSYGEVTTAYAGYNKISNGKVDLAFKTWGVNNIAYIQIDASAVEGTITKVELTGSFQQINDRGLWYGVGYNSSSWSSTLTWNTADRSITIIDGQSVSCTKTSTDKNATLDVTSAFTNDEDKIVTIIIYQTAAGGGYIKNASAKVTYTTETTADYTINFKDGEGNELKAPKTYSNSVIVGANYTASATDMETFVVNGKKYKYVSGNATKVAAANGNEITLVFQEAAKYTITLNAKGALSQEIASAQVYEGDAATLYFRKHIKSGSTWVMCNSVYDKGTQDNYYGWTFKNVTANTSHDITYSSENIDAAYEVEDMALNGVEGSAIGAGSRMSNCNGRRLAAGAYVTTDALAAGFYTIVLGARADAGGTNSKSTVSYGVVDNGVLIPSEAYFPTVDYGNTTEVTISNILIMEGQKFALYNDGGATSNLAADYITLTKTSDPTVPVTIGADGYATFVTPYPVDFTDNAIKAYYVSAVNSAEGTVTLTQVNAVPAGEAVIVKGESGNVNVTAMPELIDNLMEAAASDIAYNPEATTINYVLADGTNGVGLYPVNEGTIAAGKGYLPVAAAAAKAGFKFSIEGVTAADAIEAEAETVKAGKYATPNGIVIVKNGVKYNVAGMMK